MNFYTTSYVTIHRYTQGKTFLMINDEHLSKDFDIHVPFKEGKDYGGRSSRFFS